MIDILEKKEPHNTITNNAKLGEAIDGFEKVSTITERMTDHYEDKARQSLLKEENASKKEIEAHAEVEKSMVDVYSNEKAKAQNRMYEDYMRGGIKENFDTKVALVNDEIALMKKRADLEIKEMKLQAQNEIDALKKELETYKNNKKFRWFERIFWPVLGAIIGVVIALLLRK